MQFIKKLAFGLGAFILILWGGAGTQSKSTLLQGGGFLSLVIGLVVLYLFIKMAWRAMGCLPSFMIFAGIVMFIMYAIGAFSNGINGVGGNLKSFLGQAPRPVANESGIAMINADYAPESAEIGPDSQSGNENPPAGGLQNIVGNISEKFSSRPASSSMDGLPIVSSPAKVINGDTISLQGHYLRLYGIDAPESNQTCADRHGRSYQCGQKAASWLRDWIGENDLDCRIMQQDSRGNLVGTCSLGQYDLGAAIVNAGWALAYVKYTDVYAPYESQARENRRGLWSGTFYKPSDWKILQAQQPKIKVIKPKVKKKKSQFGF